MKTVNKEFQNWLKTLGYADSSVKSLPNYTSEMVNWLKENSIIDTSLITAESIQTFFFYWKNRKNKRGTGGLSHGHVSKGITAIHLFIRFLNESKNNPIQLQLERDKEVLKIPSVLTIKEIEQLYEATYNSTKRGNTQSFGQRDRAMLAIYYACGLRKNEGVNLKVSDILIEKKVLLVRKGKGNKERFVPITDKSLQDIEEYLNFSRKWFLLPRQKQNQESKTDAFFINVGGNPMSDFTARIRLLKEEARIEKRLSLHTFRHSIATHLLQQGMDIEQIKKFLGHSTLESTQLYTHILNEYEL